VKLIISAFVVPMGTIIVKTILARLRDFFKLDNTEIVNTSPPPASEIVNTSPFTIYRMRSITDALTDHPIFNTVKAESNFSTLLLYITTFVLFGSIMPILLPLCYFAVASNCIVAYILNKKGFKLSLPDYSKSIYLIDLAILMNQLATIMFWRTQGYSDGLQKNTLPICIAWTCMFWVLVVIHRLGLIPWQKIMPKWYVRRDSTLEPIKTEIVEEPPVCTNGHTMKGPNCDDSGWCCDMSISFKGPGCKRGLHWYDESKGIDYFHCKECDFFLCDLCKDAWLTLKPSLSVNWTNISPKVDEFDEPKEKRNINPRQSSISVWFDHWDFDLSDGTSSRFPGTSLRLAK